MARPHKPWYRKTRDTWYVEIDGKQVPLAKGAENRTAAEKEVHRLLGEQDKPTSDEEKKTVVFLFAKFLGWTNRHRSAATYDQHRHFLRAFVRHPGHRRLRPHQVTVDRVEDWFDAHSGWKKSRRHALRTLLRAFNWGVRRQLLTKNPILGIEVPGKSRVVNFLTREQRRTILAGVRDQAFRDFLTAMYETGARLCFLLHMYGDIHQPLHAAAMFSADNLAHGDQGGNMLLVRIPGHTPDHDRITAIHAVFDGLFGHDTRLNTLRDMGERVEHTPGLTVEALKVLRAERDPRAWAKESLNNAIPFAYLNGTIKALRGMTFKQFQHQHEIKVEDVPLIPDDYEKNALPVAERRIALGGYRLADALTDLFGGNH